MPAEASVLTTEFKINLLAPAEGELLRAVGRVLRPGRLLTVCDVDVFALKDGAATPCAKLLETLMCLEGRPDGPAPG
jgi:acyl-coenzyme A thioesterase PaaI-like protein